MARSVTPQALRDLGLVLLRRRCIEVILTAVVLAAVAVPVPGSAARWWDLGCVVVWTLASFTYGSTLLVLAARIARARVASARRARDAPTARAGGVARVAQLTARVRTWTRAHGRPFLPLVIMAGPLILFVRWLPAFVVAIVAYLAIGLGLALWLWQQMRGFLDVVRRLVSLPLLVFNLFAWAFVAGSLDATLSFPAPDPGGFETMAQVDATLFVAAALVFVVPPAWSDARVAWYAGGFLVMVIGLLAAIGGAVEAGSGRVLFALSLSPVTPVVASLATKAYHELLAPHRHGPPTTGDRPPEATD